MSSKSEPKTRNPETVQIGNIVHWLLQGRRNSSPVAAMVTGINANNPSLVQLSLIRKSFTALEPTEIWIRHIDDPFLKENPNHAIESGAWNFIPEVS